MTTRANIIKLADLGAAIEKATQASAGRKFPGGIIVGRIAPRDIKGINLNAVARDITKQVQAAAGPGVKLTPKVITEGGVTTMGFIFRPPVFDR